MAWRACTTLYQNFKIQPHLLSKLYVNHIIGSGILGAVLSYNGKDVISNSSLGFIFGTVYGLVLIIGPFMLIKEREYHKKKV